MPVIIEKHTVVFATAINQPVDVLLVISISNDDVIDIVSILH